MKLVRISIQISLNNDKLNTNDMDEVYSLKIKCATNSITHSRRVLKLRGRVKDKPNVMKLVRISIQISLNNEELNTDDMEEVYSLKINCATKSNTHGQ